MEDAHSTKQARETFLSKKAQTLNRPILYFNHPIIF